MNRRKFYFAAKYGYRAYLLPIASLVIMSGHTVQADWLLGCHEDGVAPGTPDDFAKLDLADIDECSDLVLFNLPTEDPEQSTGRNVEFGYALARGKRLIVVGKGKSVFYTQAHEHYASVNDFLAQYAPKGRL